VDFPVHVWIRVWWTGMSPLRCPPGRVPRGLAFCGSVPGTGMSPLRCPPGRVPRGLAFCRSQAGMERAVGAEAGGTERGLSSPRRVMPTGEMFWAFVT